MRPLIVMSMVLCCTPTASAQSTFVGGSLIGDIARFGGTEITPPPDFFPRLGPAFDGEAIGFGLSLERSLGEQWGVALEFARPGTIERDESFELPVTIQIFPPIPPFEIHQRVEQRRLSVNTLAWIAQPLGDRVELAFLAGAAFTQTKWTQNFGLPMPTFFREIEFGLINAAAPTTETTAFTVEPVGGLDTRIKLSEHLAIVPGIRFQAAGVAGRSGWLLRPAIGARWGF
jgi:hypothetical protein